MKKENIKSRMDNESPSPPKRPRTIDFLTSQLGKPVRYFPFNRKTVDGTTAIAIPQQEKLGRIERVSTINKQHIVSSSQLPVIPFSSKMKFVPNKEANISNKMQKLKLKSPDGRDLGEINVQLLPQKGDGLGGKTIMLQKHSLFGKLDNPSTVSILKPIDKNKQTAIHSPVSGGQTNVASVSLVNTGSNCVAVNTIRSVNSVRETSSPRPIMNIKPKFETQNGPLVLRQSDVPKYSNPPLGSKVFFINVDKQTGVNTVKSVNNEAKISTSNQKIIVVHAENYPDSTEGKKNNASDMGNESRRNSLSKDVSSPELASSTSNARTIPTVFWNPSKFPEFTSKLNGPKLQAIENDSVKINGNTTSDKPMIVVTQSQDSEQSKTASKSGTLAISTLQKKQKSKWNSWTIVKTSGKKLENGRKNSCESDPKEVAINGSAISRISQNIQNVSVNNRSSENTQNVTSTTNITPHSTVGKQTDENTIANAKTSNLEEKSNDQNPRENIMVIVHGDMNTLEDSEKKKLEQKESNGKTYSMEIDGGTEVNSNSTSRDGKAAKTRRESNPTQQPNETRKENASSSTPATLSPKQQDLDIIQKALSSCTDQSLRDKALKALADCGIGVKRAVPVPPTVSVSDSQTQTKVFCLLEPDILLEYSDNFPVLNKLNVINRSEQPLRNHCEASPLDEDYILDLAFDFSNEFEKFLPDESRKGVDQVKNVFSKPNSHTSQVVSQIQRDFQAATTIDSYGMMGIHRAVLSGNIREVQRQLIVLNAAKKSIEVPTGDGKTSLELAVLHDVDRCIIQALLAAGAKPAFPIKLHESALIIASRTCSSVLTELVKHVAPSSLLDIVDSEGFAPLHYCAQLGNIQGVKSLVSAGALINLRDSKSGRTALFHALENRNIEMAWYLVENGASPNIINFAGQSPAALVDECRHNSLAEKLNQVVR